MRALVLAILFVALTAAASSPVDTVAPHLVEKRETIFVKPPPGCIFYECIARCRQRGYRNGGYCTINGCVCQR